MLNFSLRSLKALSLCGCGLYDLDGIGILTGLEELLLCDNFISDVTPLALHDNIRVLDFYYTFDFNCLILTFIVIIGFKFNREQSLRYISHRFVIVLLEASIIIFI